LEIEYDDLVMYTEVRWLSRRKCLQRIFDFRREVVAFLEQDVSTEDFAFYLKYPDFLLDLAFQCNIRQHLSLSLQATSKLIFDLVATIEEFGRKMKIIVGQLNDNDLSNMPNTNAIVNEFENFWKLVEYGTVFECLVKGF